MRARLAHEGRLILVTLMAFTRLPVPTWTPYSAVYLNHATRYLPLIGWLVGGLGAATLWLAQSLWPPVIAVLLSMIATIAVTGAFHEDGLADSCDAFFGGWEKGQVLQIMKDSRLGTFGVVGLGLMLALKFVTLSHIQPQLLPAAIIAGHSVSRLLAVTLIHTHPYARDEADSKVKALTHQLSRREVAGAAFLGLLPLLLLPSRFWLFLLPLWLVRWGLGRYFVRRIGGYTGDCLGAAQQLTEGVFYLLAAMNV